MTCNLVQFVSGGICPPAVVVPPFGNGIAASVPPPPPPTPMYHRVMREYVLKGANGVLDQTVQGLFVYDLLTNSANPVSTTFWNETTGAAYVGSPTLLEATSNNDVEADQDAWCSGGVNFTRFVEIRDGMPTTNVRWLNDATNAITLIAPAGATKGVCVPASPSITITGTALAQIAGADLVAANPNFAGQASDVNTNTIAGNLVSVTISARNVQDGMSSPDRIEVNIPDGTTAYMLDGETKSFNLTRDQETSLRQDYNIKAIGNAYANIHGTFE